MTGAERDYPTLARMAAGGSEEAETAIEEIQQLRSRVRNLRELLADYRSLPNNAGALGGMFIEALRQSLIAAKAENRIAAMKRGRGITDPWCKP